MSLSSRREYLSVMRSRYQTAKLRVQKSQILDEVLSATGFNRKYAIRALGRQPTTRQPVRRHRPKGYLEALPAIQAVWEALDYPCAERLHPALLATAELLHHHGELALTSLIRDQLQNISRATLARRLAQWPTPKVRRAALRSRPAPGIHAAVPIDRYAWNETRPGALEIDLVEHNGGSSAGHFAYTLDVVDVVTGWSARRAVLGRGQAGVFAALQEIVGRWPFPIWALHSDNGSEFINDILLRFCRQHGYFFSRSRPYKKNDNAHVEQKNRQFVREVVGYARYDSSVEVAWLNQVYDCLDPYANLYLPGRKVIGKARAGAHVKKTYDTAQTPFQRALAAGVLDPATTTSLQAQRQAQSPLALHRRLERLLGDLPENPSSLTTAAD